MEKELQLITVAKACGWIIEPYQYGGYKVKKDPRDCWFTGELPTLIPDYLNNLNAMHEAEKSLTVKQQHKFAEEVGRIIYRGELSVPDFRDNWYMCYLMMQATATQRAEAFLRTLNLWKE
jgi:hypothetical protein